MENEMRKEDKRKEKTNGCGSSHSLVSMTMSSTSPSLLPLPLTSPPPTRPFQLIHLSSPTRPRLGRVALAAGDDLLGDFGARDPFPAELESRFGEKVLGNMNTEHKILIPNVSALSLAQQQCSPVSTLDSPMAEDDAQKLMRKVMLSCCF